MTRHPCRLPQLGANRALSSTRYRASSGTGSGRKRRTAAAVRIAWARSMVELLPQCAVGVLGAHRIGGPQVSALDRSATSVGRDDGAGDVARPWRGEERDDLGDLSRVGRTVQGGGGPEVVEQLACLGSRIDRAGCNCVDSDATRAVLRGPGLCQ